MRIMTSIAKCKLYNEATTKIKIFYHTQDELQLKFLPQGSTLKITTNANLPPKQNDPNPLQINNKMSTIKAWTYTHAPFPQNLTLSTLPSPSPPSSPTAIQIRIHALSLNPVDIQLHNLPLWSLPIPPFSSPKRVGCDFAGTVLSAGSASGFKVGERVYGVVAKPWADGTAAEVITVDVKGGAAVVAKIPEEWNFTQAAAVPLVWLTARSCIARVEPYISPDPSRGLAVLGGSSACGMYAVRMGKQRGWRVVASASEARNGGFVRELGADVVVDYEKGEAAVREGIQGVDAVVDCVGGTECLDVAKRYVTIVGDKTERSALGGSAVYLWNPQMVWRWFWGWVGMGLRYDCIVLDRSEEFLKEAAVLKPEEIVVDSVYKFEDLKDAMEKLEKGRVRGKVVVEIGQGS